MRSCHRFNFQKSPKIASFCGNASHIVYCFSNDLLFVVHGDNDEEDYRRNFTLQIKIIIAPNINMCGFSECGWGWANAVELKWLNSAVACWKGVASRSVCITFHQSTTHLLWFNLRRSGSNENIETAWNYLLMFIKIDTQIIISHNWNESMVLLMVD